MFPVLVLIVITLVIWSILTSMNINDVKSYLRYRKYGLKLRQCDDYYPIVGHLFGLLDSPENFFRTLRRWNTSEKNYPLHMHRVGLLHSLNIVGPEIVEAIIGPVKHLEKSHLYHLLDQWLGNGLLINTGNVWQKRRKILTTAFHFSILHDFVEIFNKEARRMVDGLIKKSNKQDYINVVPFVEDVTLRTINETSMGYTDPTQGLEYQQSLKKVCLLIENRIGRPWLYNNWAYYHLMPSGLQEKQLTKSIHKFTENVIKKKSSNFHVFELIQNDEKDETNEFHRKKLAMLDLLLNEQIKKGSIDDEGIRDEVNTFMFEGHDTTSACLSFTLMLLACHKTIQNEVYEEIIQVVGSDNSIEPSYQNLQDLNLMERCIKESLRLYPSVPVIGRILSEDIQTEAGLLPKDMQVHIHIYDIHRNPKFWPNPEQYDPSRFLPENCIDRHPFAYIPFSAGPRNCIGQRFALLEIKSVLCHVLKNFILEPIDTPETVVLFQDLILRSKNGIKVKLVPRSKFII